MSRWNGDEWRWRTYMHDRVTHATISVIDAAEPREQPPNAHRVPFGFSVRERPPEREPLLWEGSD